MRYLVTGAAGFIGSHLARALLDAGHEVVAVDSFTDYYDPARKEENAVGLGVVRADLAVDPVDGDGGRRRRGLPPRRPAGRARLRPGLPRLPDPQRARDAAPVRGGRRGAASRSSTRPPRRSTATPRRYPTPESTPPRPNSPYGITKLACEHLAGAYARSFGLEAVGLRYFTVYGPRQRPDMAFTRIAEALAEGRPFELYGDGGQSRSFTYVADVVEATIAALGAEPGTVYNVGGDTEATMREAIELFERISGRTLELRRRAARRGRHAPDEGRHDADPRRARLAGHDVARGRFARSVGVGLR